MLALALSQLACFYLPFLPNILLKITHFGSSLHLKFYNHKIKYILINKWTYSMSAVWRNYDKNCSDCGIICSYFICSQSA